MYEYFYFSLVLELCLLDCSAILLIRTPHPHLDLLLSAKGIMNYKLWIMNFVDENYTPWLDALMGIWNNTSLAFALFLSYHRALEDGYFDPKDRLLPYILTLVSVWMNRNTGFKHLSVAEPSLLHAVSMTSRCAGKATWKFMYSCNYDSWFVFVTMSLGRAASFQDQSTQEHFSFWQFKHFNTV